MWLLSVGTLDTDVGQPPNEYAAILSVYSHGGQYWAPRVQLAAQNLSLYVF